MTSLLRQIVAGPRAKHEETGLDLCYVTSNVIATSGPSQAYPQRAYRNPLDRLVAFLDSKHGENWAIWEFRAEGTGYPDEAVYNRIRHYPWPDHHPPPFKLVPMIMAGMRNWLAGGDLEGGLAGSSGDPSGKKDEIGKNGRVVVVHCKAGKGRSGTLACSYLISECGWAPEAALARFTERRMRPKFGAGVSIPSQLRWIRYVDRWRKGGKKYVDREIEVVEMHVWGLRHGVKITIEGYVDEGKKIHIFHTFKPDERFIVEGDAPGGAGIKDFVYDMAGYAPSPTQDDDEVAEDVDDGAMAGKTEETSDADNVAKDKITISEPARSKSKHLKSSKTTNIMRKLSSRSKPGRSAEKLEAKRQTTDASNVSSVSSSTSSLIPDSNDSKTLSLSNLPRSYTFAAEDEPGGQAVIFKPSQPIRIPSSDINVALERRNKAPTSIGLTMVTAVAHVWFNPFFEGQGPEQGGKADDSGIFEIDWDKMDGIKGSSRKGAKAADRIAVVWRVPKAEGPEGKLEDVAPPIEIIEPLEGEVVPQMKPANWKGDNEEGPDAEKRLGIRTQSPDSADMSRASSIRGLESGEESDKTAETVKDDESLKGVKSSGPEGEILGEVPGISSSKTKEAGPG